MDIFDNHVLLSAFGAWFIAQILKVIISLLMERRLDLWRLVSMGGMPSSHSALVSGLATAVGIENGLRSSEFALALVFASVVMYDAAGIRQAVSAQARILNRLLDEYFKHQRLDETRLRELLGHTRVEVLVGALLGIATAIFWS